MAEPTAHGRTRPRSVFADSMAHLRVWVTLLLGGRDVLESAFEKKDKSWGDAALGEVRLNCTSPGGTGRSERFVEKRTSPRGTPRSDVWRHVIPAAFTQCSDCTFDIRSTGRKSHCARAPRGRDVEIVLYNMYLCIIK